MLLSDLLRPAAWCELPWRFAVYNWWLTSQAFSAHPVKSAQSSLANTTVEPANKKLINTFNNCHFIVFIISHY